MKIRKRRLKQCVYTETVHQNHSVRTMNYADPLCLTSHGIDVKPRPTQTPNTTGKVDCKNGVLKIVLSKLQQVDPSVLPSTIEYFITNILRGSKVLSTFELSRGYYPSIMGISRRKIPQKLLKAHTEREETREFERIVRSKAPDTIPSSQLLTGALILIYYHRYKQNEKDEWKRSRCRTSRGKLRLMPN